jgi:hypothetical protein
MQGVSSPSHNQRMNYALSSRVSPRYRRSTTDFTPALWMTSSSELVWEKGKYILNDAIPSRQLLRQPLHSNAFLFSSSLSSRRAQCAKNKMERVDMSSSRGRDCRSQSLVQTTKDSQLSTPQRTTARHTDANNHQWGSNHISAHPQPSQRRSHVSNHISPTHALGSPAYSLPPISIA